MFGINAGGARASAFGINPKDGSAQSRHQYNGRQSRAAGMNPAQIAGVESDERMILPEGSIVRVLQLGKRYATYAYNSQQDEVDSVSSPGAPGVGEVLVRNTGRWIDVNHPYSEPIEIRTAKVEILGFGDFSDLGVAEFEEEILALAVDNPDEETGSGTAGSSPKSNDKNKGQGKRRKSIEDIVNESRDAASAPSSTKFGAAASMNYRRAVANRNLSHRKNRQAIVAWVDLDIDVYSILKKMNAWLRSTKKERLVHVFRRVQAIVNGVCACEANTLRKLNGYYPAVCTLSSLSAASMSNIFYFAQSNQNHV